MKTAALVGVVVVAIALIAADILIQRQRKPVPAAPAGAPVAGAAPTVASTERAPDGAHVRVQVLNATKIHGLARRATLVLRDRGFDVVETGTLKQAHDTTIVYDLSGHDDWARRIAHAFSPARVVARTDSSRYLDIAVVLGSTWRPPAQPFYP
jgi:3-oxoacyl-ACP reductase-like protein